jgi:formate dehydrogenase iron-sulfur subunit
MGCRYCMVACPFGVPKYEWAKVLPKVQKCILCPDRIAAGQPTACAEACPTGATKFGERDELIREARERIGANPSNYAPHVFGIEEVGGTSVLMLSGIPFDQWNMRLSDLPNDPLPLYTYKVLSRIPDFVPLGGIVLGGVWWITHRRDEVAEAEAAEKAAQEAGKKNGGAR